MCGRIALARDIDRSNDFIEDVDILWR